MKKWIIAILLGLFSSALSHADTPLYYAGVSYLNAETSFMGESDDDSGLEARFGYTLSEYLSLEISYLDLGAIELPNFPDAGGSVDTDGYAFTVLGTYPMNDFTLIGKAGNLWWDTEGSLGSIAGPISYAKNGNDLLFGAGVSYKLTDNVKVKVEFNDSQDFNWSVLGIDFTF